MLDLSAGKWSSPVADARLSVAEEKDIAVKWYARSQTITIVGKDRIEIEDRLNCIGAMTKSLPSDTKSPDETEGDGNKQKQNHEDVSYGSLV